MKKKKKDFGIVSYGGRNLVSPKGLMKKVSRSGLLKTFDARGSFPPPRFESSGKGELLLFGVIKMDNNDGYDN